jgi:hypothetical protein
MDPETPQEARTQAKARRALLILQVATVVLVLLPLVIYLVYGRTAPPRQ